MLDPLLKDNSLLMNLTKITRMLKVPNKQTSKPEERWIKLALFPLILSFESKKKPFSQVELSSIIEIRMGQNTRAFEMLGKSQQLEERSFSIIYISAGKYKILNLIAKTAEECLAWVSGLNILLSLDISTNIADIPISLFTIWQDVAQVQDTINLDQVTLLMRNLNVNLSKRELKGTFKLSSLGKQGKITFPQFERLYNSLKFRPDIASLFSSLNPTNSVVLSFKDFYDFLIAQQKVSWDIVKCKEVYQVFSSEEINGMSMDHFTAFLLSSRNSIIKKESTIVFQDMNRPLADYYINTSHNTYLIGDQVTGDSSVEGYIRAIQRGCSRLLGWPKWPPRIPWTYIVKNIKNRTSKILFKDAIEAIKKYAFLNTWTPLILSLEVRCSPEQQSLMAKILLETFGESLISTPLPDIFHPTVLELAGKVLVKASLVRLTEEPEPNDSESSNPCSPIEVPLERKSTNDKSKPSLASMVIYLQGVSRKDLHEKLSPNQMISITERRASSLLKNGTFEELTEKNIVRIYPSILHFTSSNFDPVPFWIQGVQMTALNFQTMGIYL